MKQARQNKSIRRPLAIQMAYRLREGLFIIFVALALFIWVSLSTFHLTDPGWSSTGLGSKVLNGGGRVGAFCADFLFLIWGYVAYLIPPLLIFAGWLGLQKRSDDSRSFHLNEWLWKCLGWLGMMLSLCGLLALYWQHGMRAGAFNAGGIIGDIMGIRLAHFFNTLGSSMVLITGFLCGMTLFTGVSWVGLVDALGRWTTEWFFNLKLNLKLKWKKTTASPSVSTPAREPNLSPPPKPIVTRPSEPSPTVSIMPKIAAAPAPKKIDSLVTVNPGTLPPLSLLDPPAPSQGKAFSHLTFEELSALVEQRLSDFGVEAKVVAVHPGPVITRFELDLAPGLKVSKITGLAKDIARSLSATSVRVVEVIPGKSVIGLELPNEHRELVCLREILESQRYAQSRSPVSLALGKDIAGYPIIVDLAKMPHLLVAGTTGSGKSVSINVMVLSMLFKATPEQLRFIMIDPKMLELSVYEGIPHLLTPVITDMKDAANALRWCVGEMDRRYRLMAWLGVRHLAGCNAKLSEAIKQGNPIPTPEWLLALGNQPPHLQPLPTIVVIVDELADMMMVVGKKVEELVTRIAQKARAAGIHLILATQRPSVDVITGLIKANVPTRIAFQVSSRIDSRTILDQQGAEQLLGNGDMLYLPPGTGIPIRVHGAYVGDEEVHRVVAAWRTAGNPVYINSITEGEAENTGNGTDEQSGEADPLYDEALQIITSSRRASISLVQRRLRIGYNRAARIMEGMEAAGVVSSMDSSGSREVLAPPPVE